ncbi:hypothetical protein PIROE2DRAFT_1996, partial [Piromyces sp. E2]
NGNRETAKENIKKFKYWAAFYIPEKFTVDVLSNLNANSKQQLTKVTVEVILDETRSYNTVSLARKALRRLQDNFFVYLARSFEHIGGFNPRFLMEKINYKETSLHTLKKYGHNFSTFISLMLIWISSISATIITHFYFPFETLSVNNTLVHILPFIGFYLVALIFMMLQITTCGGILDHAVQYGFWKIGRALPFYYGVRQLKVIIWKVGEHTTWVNLVVLFSWLIISTTISLILYRLELKARRERWLRRQHRILFNYSDDYDNNDFFNETTLTPIANEDIPMDSMEDFDFPDESNNYSSNKTLEEQNQ